MEKVILVNENDEQTGVMDKMEVHEKALLHRAFSIFIFNRKGEMLLHQRAAIKYHSGGLWTNACCSHPRPDEEIFDAAKRRLKEELGFETPLQKAFDFTYKASLNNGLSEHEFDHVMIGVFDGVIHPDPNEVQNYCFTTIEEIDRSLHQNPEKFTVWFRVSFPLVKKWWNEQGWNR